MNHLEETFSYLSTFLTPKRLQTILEHAEKSTDYILPVLEDVYQFRNAAAVVRSAEACGIHRVLSLEKRNVFDPNLTVTKGAETWVEVERIGQELDPVETLKKKGYQILAISPERDALDLPDMQVTGPMALFFGTEKEGVSQNILDAADLTVKIPMYGLTRSFNVSVAAGICFYQLREKLRHSELPYLLSEEKKLELKIRWAKNSIPSGEAILRAYAENNH